MGIFTNSVKTAEQTVSDQQSWLAKAKHVFVVREGVLLQLSQGEKPIEIQDKSLVELMLACTEKRDTVKIPTGSPAAAMESLRWIGAQERKLGADGRYHWTPLDAGIVLASPDAAKDVKFLGDLPEGYLNWVPELQGFALRETVKLDLPAMDTEVNLAELLAPVMAQRAERAARRAGSGLMRL